MSDSILSGQRLFQTTINQKKRCWYVDRNPKLLPPVVSTLEMKGPLNTDAFKAATATMARRHESLRTTFPKVDGEWYQAVSDEIDVDITWVDLTDVPTSELDASVRSTVQRLGTIPFNLAKDVLFRLFVLQLEPRKHVLGLVIDHSIVDGWAMGVFWQDFLRIYDAIASNRPVNLPDVIQLRDYGDWERKNLSGRSLETLTDYWKKEFTELPPFLSWNKAGERPSPFFTHSSNVVRLTWTVEETRRVKERARLYNCSLYCLLTAILSLTIQRSSDGNEFLIQTMVANRRKPEFQYLIGYLANAVNLRIALPPATSLEVTVERVKKKVISAFAHGSFPTAMMIDLLPPVTDDRYFLRPQVAHFHNSFPQRNLDCVAGCTVASTELMSDERPRTYDLVFVSQERNEQLTLLLCMNTGVFKDAGANELLRVFNEITGEILGTR